jgi:hypothetical protein
MEGRLRLTRGSTQVVAAELKATQDPGGEGTRGSQTTALRRTGFASGTTAGRSLTTAVVLAGSWQEKGRHQGCLKRRVEGILERE